MVFNYQYNEVEDMDNISQCLNNLLNTPEGSMPLARGFGVSWGNLSKIPPDLENDIAMEIMQKIDDYEPRVAANEVTFSYSPEGEPVITIILERGSG